MCASLGTVSNQTVESETKANYNAGAMDSRVPRYKKASVDKYIGLKSSSKGNSHNAT